MERQRVISFASQRRTAPSLRRRRNKLNKSVRRACHQVQGQSAADTVAGQVKYLLSFLSNNLTIYRLANNHQPATILIIFIPIAMIVVVIPRIKWNDSDKYPLEDSSPKLIENGPQ